MVCIYCIEDINDLKYVGSTTSKLNDRLSRHKYDKNRGHYVSSSKLNLYNCIIYELESCPENERTEREKYWIDKIDCVNEVKLTFDREAYKKKWRENNREYQRNYYLSRKN